MSMEISNVVRGPFSTAATLDNIRFNTISISDGQGASKRRTRGTNPWKTTKYETQEMQDNAFAVNAVDIDWNGAQVEENVVINTSGELLTWIKQYANNSFDSSVLDDYATKSYVDTQIENLIGGAPETLDTLKEISDALTDSATVSMVSEAISSKANSSDVYTKAEIDQMISGLQTDNTALLNRVKDLERALSSLNPQEPEEKNYNVIVPKNDESLTLEDIIASIDTEVEKPEVVQALNMTQLDNPTDTYLVYPLSWEIIENDQIVSPIIKDWNGFEVGFSINTDTPTVMVEGVEYRVSDIKLGKGTYTIEFK